MKYVGFDIPNEFVVGYGLDYAERYRDLPYIGRLKPAVYGWGPDVYRRSRKPAVEAGRNAGGLPFVVHGMNRKRILRSWWLWAAWSSLLILVLPNLLSSGSGYHGVSTSDAIAQITAGNVKKAVAGGQGTDVQLELKKPLDGKYTQDQRAIPDRLPRPRSSTTLELQQRRQVDFRRKVSKENTWLSLLVSLLPILLIVGVLFFVMSQVQGGGNRVMSFGRSKAKLVSKDTPKTTFADVAGADEAIEELEEIKEFLANPAKFQAIGAKIPKGVLLYGPPGTGKTLLARAVAGEAGVPFYSISGSDFVEMFVGVGASRVRDLFEQAKSNAPAIIFVDEIDAVGRHRGAGLGGGHDEREQTLNQLLVEMDGFDVKGGVILIAATNRPDILDPALLRPGPLRPADRRRAARRHRPRGRAEGAREGQAVRRPTSTSASSPAARRASPAPTSPTSSTRPRCSPRATTAG